MEVHWALPLAVAPASQALQRGGLVRQSKTALGLCSLTLVCFFFLVPVSHCDGFVVSSYLSWEWHCLRVPLTQLSPSVYCGEKLFLQPSCEVDGGMDLDF